MEKYSTPNFLIIDDDPLNNMICSKIIKQSIPDAAVLTFTEPEKGLAYIRETFSVHDAGNAILFLDINMPTLNGWEVLDIFNTFPEIIKKRIQVFILSSSVDPHEKQKSDNNPLVMGYIIKSLSKMILHKLFPDYVQSN